MAKALSSAKANLLSVVSFITILVILGSVFVLSGSFNDIVTTITKSKASQANPKLTQSFADAFNDGKVNEEKWTAAKSGDATINETTADNLRIDIPAGSVDGKAKGANLTFKELMKEKGDFRVVAVVYRPVVTGEGMGVSGLRFASTGTTDDEGANLQWRVNGNDSKVVFVVRAPDGTRLESEVKELKSNVAVLRLERLNKRYRAFFKPGRDVSGDVGWTPLGSEWNAALGDDGKLAVYANNVGLNGKFPKVAGRVDTIHMSWEGEEATRIGYSDAFANGNIGTKWNVAKTDGAQVYENANDNLIMSLPSGAVNSKARYAVLTRKEPVIPQGKDFGMNVRMFRPTVVGEGVGYSGMRFVSAGSVDDEAASVRWVVGKNVSRIVFAARNPDGTVAEHAQVNVPETVKAVTLRLVREGNSYRGWYRTGDSDTNWVLVGKKDDVNFGANGRVGLVVSNDNGSKKYPRVVGRFDQVNGSVAK